ncbi:hypothetical protein [Microbacterium hominis]|uniref:Uncharacterized protein n=1 Tax=Microbacterium hominis TaxID=162426 RepID=A0A7D4TPZ4_9MICO|nr:hypothetical protein [Microbacterium hominis]QKJ18704.1 hypothetical protein HQM25_04430 [Microbacterium hominis]
MTTTTAPGSASDDLSAAAADAAAKAGRAWKRFVARAVPPALSGAQPVRGLLRSGEESYRADAALVAKAAPALFGELDEFYLRGRRVMGLTESEQFEEIVREGVHEAALALTAAERFTPEARKSLERRVRCAKDFVERREGEISRRLYAHRLTQSVLFTMLVILVVVVAEYSLRSNRIIAPTAAELAAMRDILVVVGAGAAGAGVSVLLRLSHSDVSYDVARSGAAHYRIALGVAFGVAILLLLKSGVIADFGIGPGASETVDSFYFWGALGFLAGFNERWATNLITRHPGDKPGSVKEPSGAKPRTP